MSETSGFVILSVEEFEKLMKQKSNANIQNPKNIFSEVSITPNNIQRINEKYPKSNISYHVLNVSNRPIWKTKLDEIYLEDKKENAIGEHTHSSEIDHRVVHDLIRKLALACYGSTKNKDILLKDYEDVSDVYSKISKTFFDAYDERLNKIQKQEA